MKSKFWPVFMMALILAIGVLASWWTAHTTDRQMREDLLLKAQLVVRSIEIEHIEMLTGTASDLNQPIYLSLKEEIALIRAVDDQCRFIYLNGRRNDGTIFFYVDSEPPDSPDYSPPGQLYSEASVRLRKLFDTGRAEVQGPQKDRWGTWVSAFVPIANLQTGRVIALLGMDMNATAWNIILVKRSALPIFMSVLASLLAFLLLQAKRTHKKILTQEQSLRESDLRFRAAFLTSPDAININRLSDGLYLEVNDSFLRIMGYEKEEVIGRSSLELNLWADPADRTRLLEGLKTNGFVENLEAQYRRKDGEIRVGIMSARVIELEGEHYILSITRDITERKQAEEALRQNRALLSDLIEFNGALIYVKDLDGRYRLVNRKWEEVTRLERAEVIGKTDEELFPGKTGENFRAFDKKVISCKKSMEAEETLENTSGLHHFISIKFPLFDADKNVTGVCGMTTEITERYKTEEALRENEERLKSIFRVAPTGIGMVRNRVITEVNPLLCEMTGYRPEELIGQSARILYPTQEDYDFVGREKYRQIAETGTGQVETRWQRKDGTVISILLASTPLDKEYLQKGVIFTALDITERKKNEEETKKSARLLEGILNGIPDIIGILSPDHTIVRYNAAGYEFLGVTPEQAKGQKCYRLIGRNTRCEQCATSLALKSGKTEQIEKYFPDLDLWLDCRSYPLKDENGKITMIVEHLADITTRKKAQEALFESEERLRLAIQASNQGLYDLNVQTGEAKVNDQYVLMLGYDPATFQETNKAWTERLHPDDFESVSAVYLNYINGKIPEYRVEFRQRTHSGDWKWILSMGQIVELDSQGRPLRMLGTHTDISERKQSEEILQQRESYLSAIIENQPGLLWLKDHESRFLATNKAFAKSCGQEKPEYLIGKTDLDIWPEELGEKYRQDDFRVMKEGKSDMVEEPIFDQGETRWFETYKTPVRDATGKIIGTTGFARDITERKKAEQDKARLESQLQQAQKMESIGRLAGGVAHDFNNLLTGITGYTEIMLSGLNHEDPMYNDLSEIKAAADRAAALTAQLLAFSRKQVIDPKVLDLNDLLNGATKMVKRLIGEDIELVFIPQQNLSKVKVDAHQMEQVLVNLAVNARDAMPEGGKLTIKTDNVEIDKSFVQDHVFANPGKYILLSVKDTGGGILPEVQQHMFEPFFTTKEKGKGTGLGLSTIYGIVKQNHGFISYHSEINRGTTFEIYLPSADGESQTIVKTKESSLPIGQETILLIEDEAMVRNLAQKILERQGYKVIALEHGGQAVLMAENPATKFDLLLTDVVMPNMNGRQLYEKMQSLRPGLRVLYMSGYTEDVIAHHGVLEKDISFLQKPFTIESLLRKVREVLDQ